MEKIKTISEKMDVFYAQTDINLLKLPSFLET